MEEEDLLARIGAHAREEGADDAVWERVARGEATAEELAELERRAEGDPDVAAMLAATRPLGARSEARIAERLAPPPAQAGVVAIRRDLGRRALAYVGPLALAAAVILYLVAGRHTRSADEGPELPVYAVTALGQQAMRGPAEPATRLHLKTGADAGFEIVARPETAAAERIVAYAFVIGEGEPSPLDAKVEIAPEGSVRIRGTARALTGAREVRLVLGTPAAIGRFEDAVARARVLVRVDDGPGSARIRVVVIPVDRD